MQALILKTKIRFKGVFKNELVKIRFEQKSCEFQNKIDRPTN